MLLYATIFNQLSREGNWISRHPSLLWDSNPLLHRLFFSLFYRDELKSVKVFSLIRLLLTEKLSTRSPHKSIAKWRVYKAVFIHGWVEGHSADRILLKGPSRGGTAPHILRNEPSLTLLLLQVLTPKKLSIEWKQACRAGTIQSPGNKKKEEKWNALEKDWRWLFYLKDPSCQSRGLSCITQEEKRKIHSYTQRNY